MNFLKIFYFLACFCCVIQSRATIILVENVNDSGVGSFRAAIAEASLSANDTILIDAKGAISLVSPLEFNSFTALTVIGPYAKHNTISAVGIWTGSFFDINNSAGIIFRNLGFDGGNGNNRHITIEDCADDITFERCIFQNNDLSIPLANGGAVEVLSSFAVFKQCSFIDNRATKGGAISTSGSSVITVTNCTFSGNEAVENSGALIIDGGTTATFLFNTFVNNEATIAPEAISAALGSIINFGNNAIGDNGTDRQMELNGVVSSFGRNQIKQNFGLEPLNITVMLPGDTESLLVNLGLRASILEDGYGLKYWPITSSSSDLINPASPGDMIPDFDCRNAPRNLKGTSAVNNYPDAGACEYTHLRVTNNSGDKSDPNSFLWTLEAAQQKDDVHYVEFDIISPSNIMFTDIGYVESYAYIIDGYSQTASSIPGPHFDGTPGVTPPVLPINFERSGGTFYGLVFNAGSQESLIQGVRLQRFNREGIQLNENNISIFGCEVGLNNSGSENGNKNIGISIGSSNNIVGGWEHWMRNTISGNGTTGGVRMNIKILSGGNSNTIFGNIIGGGADGVSSLGGVRTRYGIYNETESNIFGNSLPNAGNIIVFNEYGIYLTATGDLSTIANNLIGVGWDKTTSLGNSKSGVSLNGSNNTMIGGNSIEYGNIIAYNESGIEMSTSAESNSILGNSIYSNTFQGIDFNNNDIVQANDGLLSGSQSNQGMDFPELTSASNCSGATTVTTFDLRVPDGSYRVEFFSVSSPDPTNGEGETFIDATTISVTSNPQTIVYDHGVLIAEGSWLTATATQMSTGNTSEFGINVLVGEVLEDPSISYDDICPWQIATPNIEGDLGGTFRFSDPAPIDGATINAVSGEVMGGLEGMSYEVIYSFPEPCLAEDTATFAVLTIDETFTFSNFCPGSSGIPTSIATPGGLFSLNPDFGDGAAIAADSGILTGGIEGSTYTVQYIADNGACLDTGYVDVLVTLTDPSFTLADFCPEVLSEDAVPVTPGGNFQFAPDLGDGATIDTGTGAITGGLEGATYMIQYVVGVCAEVDTISVSVITIDESFVFNDFCPGTVGSPTSVETGGGVFSFDVDLGDGAVIDDATGDITGGIEGTTYPIKYVVNVGGCSDSTTVNVLVIPTDETFSMTDICPTITSAAAIPATPGGVFSFDPLPVDGATINAGTGAITSSVEGSTYTVKYAIGTCSEEFFVAVSVIETLEGFVFNNFCAGTIGSPTSLETGGGVFSFDVDLGDGATIDALTGDITGGIEGTTYTVQYMVIDGGCSDSTTADVLVIPTDETFTMADICPMATSAAALPATLGGAFSFDPFPGDGASINASTGAITGGLEGSTYTVKYVVGPCDEEFFVDVDVIETLGGFVFDDFCPGTVGSPTSIETGGGVFTFEIDLGDGATIDDVTGDITGGIEGTTYNVIYTVGVCAKKDTAYPTLITVLDGFTFPEFCAGTIGSPASVETDGGIFSFNVDLGDGATIDAVTGDIIGGVEGTTYAVQYLIIDGGCSDSTTVDVLTTPTDETFTMADICPTITSAGAIPITPGGVFSFDPLPGDGASINPSTGAITASTEGSTYTLKYVVGPCDEEFFLDVNVIETFGGFVFDDFCPEVIGSPTSIETGGGVFAFEIDLGDGATIDDASGEIFGGIEGSTYTVKYVVGSCGETFFVDVDAIEVLEGFTFPDFCEVNDSSAIVPTAEDPLNSNYILLSPDDGATIDATTGRIFNPQEGTIYTIVDSVWNSGCWQADTLEVLTIDVDEYFEYTDVCIEGSEFPFDVELGGIFSIVTDPGDGITISPLTGELSGGLVGVTYTIRYIKDSGLCADTLEQEVTFIAADASFEFADFCPGLDPSPTPTALFGGGVYDFSTSPLDGETINTITGQIIGAFEGSTYDIIYTLIDPDFGCADSQIESVNVKVVNESLSYEDFCWESLSEPAILLEIGGTIAFGTPAPIDGATIDDEGIISGATEGNEYEVVHTLTTDGCTQSDSILVTALGVDESFIFEDYCPSTDSPAPISTTDGGLYSFVEPPGDGATINELTGVITGSIEGEYYIVMYSVDDVTGTCNESSLDTVYVIGNDESFIIDDFCAEFPSNMPISTIGGGTYTFEPEPEPGDDAIIDPITGIITSAEPAATYGVMYTLTLDGCTEYDTNLVIALESEVADFMIESYCPNNHTSIEITGTPGGLFDFDPSPSPDGSTIDSVTGVISGSNGGTYEIIYITPGSAITCADTIIKPLLLFDIPSILTISSEEDLYCPADILDPISVSDSYAASQIYWYIGDVEGSISDSSFTYTPESLNVGSNLFYAQAKSDEGCYGGFESYTLYLSDTSGMQAISDFQICRGSQAQLLALGGVSYEWITDVPLADYTSSNPIAFSLNEEIYLVSIINEDGCQVIDSVKVSFSSMNECDIDVYNAFSPNNDGKNDFWYIDNLINYIPNTVYIYNRWGDKLQEITDYDNINRYWDGKDKNGNDLPPNTYFYVVITEITAQSQAGWVQLVR